MGEIGPAGSLASVLQTVFIAVPGADAGPLLYGRVGIAGAEAGFRVKIDDQDGEVRRFEISVKQIPLV